MVAKKPSAPAAKLTKAMFGPAATVFEKLQKLDEERAKLDQSRQDLLESAKSELLAHGQAVVAELKTLGFTFALIEPAQKSHHKQEKGERGIRERAKPQVMCPICKFHTAPQDHDRRSHRHQVPKAPFDAAELARRGLTRI
jgi:hypothetical protein